MAENVSADRINDESHVNSVPNNTCNSHERLRHCSRANRLSATTRSTNGNFLQGIGNSNTTLALLAIASNTINKAVAYAKHMHGQPIDAYHNNNINNNELDDDYVYGVLDNLRPIYLNKSVNTVAAIARTALPIVSDATKSNDVSDVNAMNMSKNLLIATTSAVNALKTNITAITPTTQLPATATMQFNESDVESTPSPLVDDEDNYWALFALILVLGTAAGNILVCLAIAWERRLQNVTNYFLMSLAITDLMVAILVMPFGILTLYKGKFFKILLRNNPYFLFRKINYLMAATTMRRNYRSLIV